MDDLRTLWPEPTGDSNTQEERGSKLLGTELFLAFSSTNENSELEKMTRIFIALHQASFHKVAMFHQPGMM